MRTRWRFGETRCALFAPSFKAFCRRSKRQKRDFLKILMKRTRVETESDEKKRVDGRGRSFGPFFRRSFPSFFFSKKFLNFVAPVLRCSRFFFHFFSSFFLLFFSFSLVCVVRQSFTSPELKLFFLSFFLSFRASVFEERERREREETKPKFVSLIRFLRC